MPYALNKDRIAQVQELLNRFDENSIARLLGSYEHYEDYDEASFIVQRYLDWFGDLGAYDLNLLPATGVSQIQQHVEAVVNRLSKFHEYSVQKRVLMEPPTFQHVIGDLNAYWDTAFNDVARCTALLNRHSELSARLRDLNGKFEEAKIRCNDLKITREKTENEYVGWSERIRDLEGRCNEKLSKMEKILKDIGVNYHALKFKQESWSLVIESMIWLVASLLIIGTLIWYTIIVLEPQLSDMLSTGATTTAWSVLVARAIIFSLGSVALFVSIRNYSACRHNLVVNRHRENALATFDIFAEATESDPDAKRAVLLETTRAIFAPQPSGYLKAANELNAGTHVVELVRNVVTGQKSPEV